MVNYEIFYAVALMGIYCYVTKCGIFVMCKVVCISFRTNKVMDDVNICFSVMDQRLDCFCFGVFCFNKIDGKLIMKI